MGDMLDRVQVCQSAIGRNKAGCRADDLCELLPQLRPVLRIEGANACLAAQPPIVKPNRDVRPLREPTEPFRRQIYIEGHSNAANDAPLRIEPVAQRELEPVAPDVNAAVQ